MKRLVLFMMAVMLLSIIVNAQKKGGKTLVAYFSATGTTARAAKLVAETVDGTLYEIQPADSKSRPALYSKLGSLAEYDTIYIGFPIWWNLAPRIINTFIESGDFAGKTVIPFATSGSSSISNAEKELQTNYPGINWGKGRLLNGASRETVKQWIKK